MDEAVSDRRRSVGMLLLADGVNEFVDAVEPRKNLFCFRVVTPQHARNDGRVELDTFHAGGYQNAPLVVVQLIDLSLDHAAYRHRNLALDLRDLARQLPHIIVPSDHSLIAQIAKEIDHEERTPLRFLVHHALEILRETIDGEFQSHVPLDVFPGEKL